MLPLHLSRWRLSPRRRGCGTWGEGAAPLQWWFLGRPAGLTKRMSSFAAIWGDVLPPMPQDVWQGNLARVVEHMRSHQR